MPELPEVEVVRRGLQSTVAGRRLLDVSVREGRLRWPVPADLPEVLRGRTPARVERRGKYLLFEFPGHGVLIAHLGMSGSLRFSEHPPERLRHDHVELRFEHGVLRYHDPRRFGALLWHPERSGPVRAHPLLAGLGVEPLLPGFDGTVLKRAWAGRRVAVKQALLAGDAVVGVGNIYASESLFRAGIRPTTAAGRVSLPRCERLATEIRATLSEAIERGGSTLRDFVNSEGRSGYFQQHYTVYGRTGQPCHACGTPVRMQHQNQRSTFWCPRCQH